MSPPSLYIKRGPDCPPLNGCMKVQSLVNFAIFSTTPQFFQIIQTEIGDTKKTISDTWFSAMTLKATCDIM